jgi:hypothetical protein
VNRKDYLICELYKLVLRLINKYILYLSVALKTIELLDYIREIFKEGITNKWNKAYIILLSYFFNKVTLIFHIRWIR